MSEFVLVLLEEPKLVFSLGGMNQVPKTFKVNLLTNPGLKLLLNPQRNAVNESYSKASQPLK